MMTLVSLIRSINDGIIQIIREQRFGSPLTTSSPTLTQDESVQFASRRVRLFRVNRQSRWQRRRLDWEAGGAAWPIKSPSEGRCWLCGQEEGLMVEEEEEEEEQQEEEEEGGCRCPCQRNTS